MGLGVYEKRKGKGQNEGRDWKEEREPSGKSSRVPPLPQRVDLQVIRPGEILRVRNLNQRPLKDDAQAR